jgi:transaldolase
MKFFLDTANVAELREGVAMGLVDGVTTNPSLIAKEGRPFREIIHEIVEIVEGPISAECVTTTCEEMVKEGTALAKIHKNIVVKLPCGIEGLKATRILKKAEIPVNMTLCFSANQALLAAKAGAAFISPFLGRLDDISMTGMDLIDEIRTIYDHYHYETEILVASIRNPIHVKEAALIGADVSTMPMSTFRQLIKHPLTDIGIARFLEDWQKVPK